MPQWVVAVVVAAVGNTLIALGMNVEKHSIMHHQARETGAPTWRQPGWLAGFLMFVIGNASCAAALSMAASMRCRCQLGRVGRV